MEGILIAAKAPHQVGTVTASLLAPGPNSAYTPHPVTIYSNGTRVPVELQVHVCGPHVTHRKRSRVCVRVCACVRVYVHAHVACRRVYRSMVREPPTFFCGGMRLSAGSGAGTAPRGCTPCGIGGAAGRFDAASLVIVMEAPR